MNNIRFTGIMSALVSPLNEDGSIRKKDLTRLMNWHLSEGFTGFYLCGGTGEGTVMQPEARMDLVEYAKAEVGDKAKLIAHVGAIDLITATKLARHAGRIGLDGISSVPPFFYRYGEKEIAQYYTALAEASGLPVIMYASPLAGVPITCEMVDRLMDIPGMVGVKWTSADYYTMRRIRELRGGDINVLNGPDEMLLCGLVMGADGGIGATYNVMPRVIQRIYNAYTQGDLEAARQAQFQANRLIHILIKYDVIPAVKAILDHLGYDCGFCTYPMKRLEEQERQAMVKDLEAIGYFKDYI
jgi:N-acetylneuraminate lyase